MSLSTPLGKSSSILNVSISFYHDSKDWVAHKFYPFMPGPWIFVSFWQSFYLRSMARLLQSVLIRSAFGGQLRLYKGLSVTLKLTQNPAQLCHPQSIFRLTKLAICDSAQKTCCTNPTIHHSHIPQYTIFVTEMCTCVHISVTKWCIVGHLSNVLWDLWDESIWMSSLIPTAPGKDCVVIFFWSQDCYTVLSWWL